MCIVVGRKRFAPYQYNSEEWDVEANDTIIETESDWDATVRQGSTN